MYSFKLENHSHRENNNLNIWYKDFKIAEAAIQRCS